MLPDFPEIKRAAFQYLLRRIEELSHQGGVLNEMPIVTMHEGDISSTTSIDGYTDEAALQKIESHYVVTDEEVIKNGFDAFLPKIQQVAGELSTQAEKIMLRKMEQVTEKTGHVVSAKGQGITPSILLEALEKMPIEFDKNGNIRGLVLILHPKQFEELKKRAQEWENDVEYKRAFSELMERKRKEWSDRENNRKLVD
jgi:hypothetical protein